MANKNLQAAKAAKKDEFYTQLSDIEKELRHYKEHFSDKTVLCNCDDPRVSNFFRYFAMNFEHLGLKRLICTCYKHQNIDLFHTEADEPAVYIIYEGTDAPMPDFDNIEVKPLKGDGDFRSPECIELLKQADIVVTNPPFSLFREYVAQLMKYEKKFLILGDQKYMGSKDIFPLLKDNKIWLGFHSGHTLFAVPDDYDVPDYYDINDKQKLSSNGYKFDGTGKLWRDIGSICWFTNLDHTKRHEPLILYRQYNEEDYPTYDNFEAIDVDKANNIPEDYYGIMGVPLTYLERFCPDQFEIIGYGCGELAKSIGVARNYRGRTDLALTKNGVSKCPFARILIRRKQQ